MQSRTSEFDSTVRSSLRVHVARLGTWKSDPVPPPHFRKGCEKGVACGTVFAKRPLDRDLRWSPRSRTRRKRHIQRYDTSMGSSQAPVFRGGIVLPSTVHPLQRASAERPSPTRSTCPVAGGWGNASRGYESPSAARRSRDRHDLEFHARCGSGSGGRDGRQIAALAAASEGDGRKRGDRSGTVGSSFGRSIVRHASESRFAPIYRRVRDSLVNLDLQRVRGGHLLRAHRPGDHEETPRCG